MWKFSFKNLVFATLFSLFIAPNITFASVAYDTAVYAGNFYVNSTKDIFVSLADNLSEMSKEVGNFYTPFFARQAAIYRPAFDVAVNSISSVATVGDELGNAGVDAFSIIHSDITAPGNAVLNAYAHVINQTGSAVASASGHISSGVKISTKNIASVASVWNSIIDKLSTAFMPLFYNGDSTLATLPISSTHLTPSSAKATEGKLPTNTIVRNTIERLIFTPGLTRAELDQSLAALRSELIALNDSTKEFIQGQTDHIYTSTATTIIDSSGGGTASGGDGSFTGDFAGSVAATTLSVSDTATSTFAGNLDVAGDFNFNGNLFQNGLPFAGSQWTTSGSDIYYNSGNVGVGTTNPLAQLHSEVGGGFSTTEMGAFIFGSTDSGNTFTDPSGNNPTKATLTVGSNWGTASGNVLNVYSAAGDLFLVRADGYVGIGTTTPSTLFSIQGASYDGSFNFDDGLGNPMIKLTDYQNAHNFSIQQLYSSGRVAFSANGNEAFTIINSSGNVGIGTTTPSAKLAITGNGTGSGKAFVVANSSNATKFAVTDSGDVTMGTTLTAGPDGGGFVINSQGTDAMTIFGSQVRVLQPLGFTSSNDLFLTRSAASTLRLSSDASSGSANLVVNGNIGIGTNSPLSGTKADIYNASSPTNEILKLSFLAPNNTTVYPVLSMSNAYNNGATNGTVFRWEIGKAAATGAADGKLYLKTYAENSTGSYTPVGTALTIDANANVTVNNGLADLAVVSGSPYVLSGGADAAAQALSIYRNGPGYKFNTTLAVKLDSYDTSGITARTRASFWVNDASSAGTTDTTVDTNVMSLLGNGRVGVGSTTPFATLAVNPTAGGASNQFVVGSSTATNFIITNGGNVGIGTSAPTGKLEVAGTSNSLVYFANGSLQAGTGGSTGFSFANTTGVTWTLGRPDGAGSLNGGTEVLDWQSNNSSLALRGNVSFGTSFASRDTILSRSAANTLLLSSDGSTGLASLLVNGKIGIGTSTPFATLAVNPTAGNASNQFVVGSSTATSFVINNSGNVGIGTASPTDKLTIAAAGGNISIGSLIGGSINSIYLTSATGAGNYNIAAYTGGGLFLNRPSGEAMNFGENNSYQMTIASGGNISMTNDLSVTGTVTSLNTLTGRGNINARSSTATDGYIAFSPGNATKQGYLSIYKPGPTRVGYFGYDDGSGVTNLGLNLENSANFVVNGGIVGIGTTTPFATLSVNPIAGQASNQFAVGSSTATNFIIDNSGKVGIGAASPTATLSITPNITTGTFSGTVGQSFLVNAATYNDSGTTGTRTIWGANSFGTPTVTATNAVTITDSATLYIPAAPVASTNITQTKSWAIYAVGNTLFNGRMSVGAGTPSAMVDIVSGAGGQTFSATNASRLLARVTTVNDSGTAGTRTVGTAVNFLQDTWTGTNAVTVTDASTLYVAGPPKASTNMTFTNAHGINIAAGTVSGSITNSYGLTVNTQSGATNNYAAQFLGGNVGIATSSPWKKLSVTGTMAIDGLSAAGASDQNVCINPTTKEVTFAASCTGSSQRFKHNISDLDEGLDFITSLRPVSFEYNDSNQKSLGFIAEEVNLLDPRLVFYDADGVTPRGITYEKFVPILTKAIQELKAKFDSILAWFKGGKFNVQNDVCVDDVCVTKEQFKQMLLNAGGNAFNSNTGGGSNNSGGSSGTGSSTDSGTATTTDSNATSTDSGAGDVTPPSDTPPTDAPPADAPAPTPDVPADSGTPTP